MSGRGPVGDRGSVAPLVIGMALVLLVLGYAVTAAGSAFLQRQQLQALCDGAAAAAGDTVRPSETGGPGPRPATAAAAAALRYLSTRDADVRVQVSVSAGAATVQCARLAPVVFGELFGSPQVEVGVTAVGRPAVRP
ncbi:pilus assembly protein TadG-related protein [Nakamurella alba]|uniref:pilus assembly protein TadG-related protein n=1 Tax=Nakamurella alba TaxID=2665158 RepID=UPI0018A97232|nr:pilus assembly protein TadG-related protein [Nakamurella alba]